MNEHIEPSRVQETRDRLRVLQVLALTGPRTHVELARRPELVGWSQSRLERALVGIWADGRVSVDAADAFFVV